MRADETVGAGDEDVFHKFQYGNAYIVGTAKAKLIYVVITDDL